MLTGLATHVDGHLPNLIKGENVGAEPGTLALVALDAGRGIPDNQAKAGNKQVICGSTFGV